MSEPTKPEALADEAWGWTGMKGPQELPDIATAYTNGYTVGLAVGGQRGAESMRERAARIETAAGKLCEWVRHTVPEWTSEVEKYLEATEAAIRALPTTPEEPPQPVDGCIACHGTGKVCRACNPPAVDTTDNSKHALVNDPQPVPMDEAARFIAGELTTCPVVSHLSTPEMGEQFAPIIARGLRAEVERATAALRADHTYLLGRFVEVYDALFGTRTRVVNRTPQEGVIPVAGYAQQMVERIATLEQERDLSWERAVIAMEAALAGEPGGVEGKP